MFFGYVPRLRNNLLTCDQKCNDKLPLELRLKNCVGNLNVDPLHNITVLHRCIKHFDSKCFIQRCKTVMLCNGSTFKFPTQFLRRNSGGNLSLHLNYYISWCYSVRLASIIGKRAFSAYTL